MFDKIRKLIIGKLIKDTDGYVYLGLIDGEPVNFYYDENIKKYVLGKRCGNFYYNLIGINGLSAYMSKNLSWNETRKQPRIVSFGEWIYGIANQINEDCHKLIQR